MTANYTPETYEVKGAWGHWSQSPDADAEFERWLDEHDAAHEHTLRTQIATDIRAVANGPTDWDDGYYEGRHDAARIAEEGTTK